MAKPVATGGRFRLVKIVAGVSVLAGAALALLGLDLLGGFGAGTGIIGQSGEAAKDAEKAETAPKGSIVLKDAKIFIDGRETSLDDAKAHIRREKTANIVVHGSAMAVHVSRIKAFCDEEKIRYSSTVVSDK